MGPNYSIKGGLNDLLLCGPLFRRTFAQLPLVVQPLGSNHPAQFIEIMSTIFIFANTLQTPHLSIEDIWIPINTQKYDYSYTHRVNANGVAVISALIHH